MRQVLFVPREEREVALLTATLEPKGCQVTSTRDTHVAGKLLQDTRYDALIISEPLCHGADRRHTSDLVELAERRRIPVVLFPADPGPVFPRVEPIFTQPTLPPRTPSPKAKQRLSRTRLEEVFEETIRPAFQARGGDVELVDVIGKEVILRFLGVCAVCPAARNGPREEIENYLRNEVPGVESVVVEQDGFPPGRWW